MASLASRPPRRGTWSTGPANLVCWREECIACQREETADRREGHQRLAAGDTEPGARRLAHRCGASGGGDGLDLGQQGFKERAPVVAHGLSG